MWISVLDTFAFGPMNIAFGEVIHYRRRKIHYVYIYILKQLLYEIIHRMIDW